MSNLLLVDDDIELCELLQEYLQAEGFTVDVVNHGDEAPGKAQQADYELIILDVMLPGKNGFEVLRELRNQGNTPVIMLTAKGDDVDRIVGLEMGADDYLPKPCNPRELVARVRAILRRSENQMENERRVIKLKNVEIQQDSREVLIEGNLVELTSSEYNILEYLAQQLGKVVSKADLTEKALSRKLTAHDRSIDMHVSNLRTKLNQAHGQHPHIKTIRGVGYMLINE